MYSKFDIDKKIINLVNAYEEKLVDKFKFINEIYEYNQLKILNYKFINFLLIKI